jgi:hypothetical protein
MLDGPSLLWRLIATTCMPRAPTVATGETRPSLMGYNSSNGTTVIDQLPIATEGYKLSVQRRIVVVFNTKWTRKFQRREASPFEKNLNMSFLNQYMIILRPKNTHKSHFMYVHHYYNNEIYITMCNYEICVKKKGVHIIFSVQFQYLLGRPMPKLGFSPCTTYIHLMCTLWIYRILPGIDHYVIKFILKWNVLIGIP